MGIPLVDVIAKGAREKNLDTSFWNWAPSLDKEPNAGGNGSFGELQLAYIPLADCYWRSKHHRLIPGEAPVGQEPAQIEPRCRRVNQTASADAARAGVAQDVTPDLTVDNVDPGDGARCGAHAHGDAGSFEGRTCGRGGTQEAVTIADNNFSIGPQIDQYCRRIPLVQTGSQYTGQNVTAHKSPEAGQKINFRVFGKVPPKVRPGKDL